MFCKWGAPGPLDHLRTCGPGEGWCPQRRREVVGPQGPSEAPDRLPRVAPRTRSRPRGYLLRPDPKPLPPPASPPWSPSGGSGPVPQVLAPLQHPRGAHSSREGRGGAYGAGAGPGSGSTRLGALGAKGRGAATGAHWPSRRGAPAPAPPRPAAMKATGARRQRVEGPAVKHIAPQAAAGRPGPGPQAGHRAGRAGRATHPERPGHPPPRPPSTPARPEREPPPPPPPRPDRELRAAPLRRPSAAPAPDVSASPCAHP